VLSAEQFLSILNEELPVSKKLISIQENAPTLPLAYDFKQTGLDKLLPDQVYTSMRDGIRRTAQQFLSLHKAGLLDDRDLS